MPSIIDVQKAMQNNLDNFENSQFIEDGQISEEEATQYVSMVEQNLSEEERQQIDENGDGSLSLTEIANAIELNGLGIDEDGTVCLSCGETGDHFH